MSTEQPLTVPGPVPAAASAGVRPEPGPAAQRRRTRRRARRVVLLVAAALVVAIAVAALLLARDARTAQRALDDAAGRVPQVERDLADGGDPAALEAQLAALRRDTAVARAHTDGPLWAIGARLPVAGPNIDAVARIAAALDDVARDVAPALVEVRATVAGIQRTEDGGIDLAALTRVAPRLTTAQTAMDAATASLGRIDGQRLLPRLAGPLDTLRARLDGIGSMVTTAGRAATLVPPMLGADGPRTYLVLAMTNAELRSGGGIVGSAVLLRADGGRVEVITQVAATDVPTFTTPVEGLDPETTAVFSDRPARFVQDVTMTPEFPTTAALAARMWAQTHGEQVDGVVATDPVALARLLAATGPVDVPLPAASAARLGMPSVSVSADNAVQLLEHDVYVSLALGPHDADTFFGSLVAATAARLESADVGASALVKALAAGADDHRVLVWSARADEQARLAGTVLGGTFLSSPRAADAVGVFFDDAISGKMSWFLDSSVTLVSSTCTDAGRVDTVDVTLTSTAPADAATLPTYVAGWPNGIDPQGIVRTVVRLAGPVGAPTPRLHRDGVVLGMETHPLRGRSIASGTITLAPGETTTLRVESTASAASSRGEGPQPAGTLDLWSTPTAHAGGLHVVPVPVCPEAR
ncbi:DUF4012 domain-containing protein [Xylanimonas allomyrinae]|uniref:DUF4012 domain-containing protein n=1 Tax=Xylanimonas allomyrinae TaxID=2509459 RepID=A0A4V0YEC1_9MICO|nr:DUF4012 domain-containing protein [Xylanimonas allomyrinae]QAY63691.1 DUF4012 domain-containing protein [Xylanimonas allomyrinae]